MSPGRNQLQRDRELVRAQAHRDAEGRHPGQVGGLGAKVLSCRLCPVFNKLDSNNVKLSSVMFCV